MGLQIRRLSYNLGAEIIGIDIRKPLDGKTRSEVHSAFLEHCILLFRGQPLTQEQHIAFSRQFGELWDHDTLYKDRHPEFPEILLNTNKPVPGARTSFGYGATVWHSDKIGGFCPALATLLRSIEVPEVGGDTMFANMYLAYEALSDGMKKLIDGLYAAYFGGEQLYDKSTPERLAETKRLNPPMALPLVRVHPETGRKALYLGGKVKQFVGMTVEESGPLLQFLQKHAERPQLVYRHRWRKDDLLMWDNRCTNHLAVGDFDKAKIRHLERTTIMGTPSLGYVIEDHHQYVY